MCIRDRETDVASANADAGALKYIVNAAARGALKSTEKASNTAQFVWEGNEINGYQLLFLTSLLTTTFSSETSLSL